jgi:hypothetical protein
MKKLKICILFLLIFSIGNLTAQTSLIVFSKDNRPFDLYINSKKQNRQPNSQIMVDDLYGETINFKVLIAGRQNNIFVKKNQIPLLSPDGKPVEITYILTKNRNGQYKLKFYSMLSRKASRAKRLESTPKEPREMICDRPHRPINDNIIPTREDDPCHGLPKFKNFRRVISQMNDESFDDSKLNFAKHISKSHCLTSKHVVDFCNNMSFDRTKLDFAKYAYSLVLDPENYYLVENSFTFSARKKELRKFIQTQQSR